MSVSERKIDLLVDEAELAARRDAMPPAPPAPTRGYAKLYQEATLQAEDGCDFDFLRSSDL